MSGMRLSVAMISSQKKKLYLKSSITIELIMISPVNNPNANMSPL